jgi:hypothetical protein
MYSRAEASLIKQSFYTALGQYMAPVLSSEGIKINWINYKTGYKHVYFRIDTDKKKASISIELTHPDPISRLLFYERLQELKFIFNEKAKEEWIWETETTDDSGKPISRVNSVIENASVFNKNDWPKLIAFFKKRLILLDEFWNEVKDAFEDLRDI